MYAKYVQLLLNSFFFSPCDDDVSFYPTNNFTESKKMVLLTPTRGCIYVCVCLFVCV